MSRIVILTGAGISAESGLETFRAEDGLWAHHRVEDVATPEGYTRDPDKVIAFYNARRAQASKAQPNAAHRALARLEEAFPGEVLVVTQNVDDLHERGGSDAVIHMHGTLKSALCATCGHRWEAPPVMTVDDRCPRCTQPTARPDIVWFGEMPYQMDEIFQHLAQADIFVSIGTSGNVYPAAGFVSEASAAGAHTIEFNLERSSIGNQFAEHRTGPASRTVAQWVGEMTGKAGKTPPRPDLPF